MAARKKRGPCAQCVHFRKGASVATAAFRVMVAPLKPSLEQVQSQCVQQERQSWGMFRDTLANLEEIGEIEYPNRPTEPALSYCGILEFENRYFCCEVKNQDNKCDEFEPKGAEPTSHVCTKCQHNRLPLPDLVKAIKQIEEYRRASVTGAKLQQRAASEYTSCIEYNGFLSDPPGFLPLCEAHSSQQLGRYIVGPIANAGERCSRWSEGQNHTNLRALAEIGPLLAAAKRATAEAENLKGDVLTSGERKATAANAEADSIEYCLKGLCVPTEEIESLCEQYTQAAWQVRRGEKDNDTPWVQEQKQRAAEARRRRAEGSTAAYQTFQPSPPSSGGVIPVTPRGMNPTPEPALPEQFIAQLNVPYQHPRDPGVIFVVTPLHQQLFASVLIARTGRRYDFPIDLQTQGVWRRLQADIGLLPISLCLNLYAGYASGVLVRWH